MGKRDQRREQAAADALAALGNRTRLRICKLLVRAGPDGADVGAIQRMLDVPATTPAHHLGTLTHAGLVRRQRCGRAPICTATHKAVAAVLDYVKCECRAGLEAAATAHVDAA